MKVIIKRQKLHGTKGFALVDAHTSELVQNVCYLTRREAQKALDLYNMGGQIEEEKDAGEGSEAEGEVPSGGSGDGADSPQPQGDAG